jgi:hypothetical protein
VANAERCDVQLSDGSLTRAAWGMQIERYKPTRTAEGFGRDILQARAKLTIAFTFFFARKP